MKQEGKKCEEARDPKVDDLLHDAQGNESDLPSFSVMYEKVRQQIAEEDERPLTKLREQPTARRRLIAMLAFATILAVGASMGVRPDLGLFPTWRFSIQLLSTGALLAVALFLALRPHHVPTLSTWKVAALCGVTVAATVILAVLPQPLAAGPIGAPPPFWNAVNACALTGLLAGVPVFVVARLLDRGTHLSALLAGAAAGLTGNMVLQIHCPATGRAHLLLAHAPLSLLFILLALAAYAVARTRHAS